jgi:hypothetical protein
MGDRCLTDHPRSAVPGHQTAGDEACERRWPIAWPEGAGATNRRVGGNAVRRCRVLLTYARPVRAEARTPPAPRDAARRPPFADARVRPASRPHPICAPTGGSTSTDERVLRARGEGAWHMSSRRSDRDTALQRRAPQFRWRNAAEEIIIVKGWSELREE